MNIKIYEDQTGIMMHPEKSSSKNADIVKLFDNKVDLCITSKNDEIEIICYLLIHKGISRSIGSYIIGKDKYSDKIFENFKNESNNALKSIGFEHHNDDKENVIFNNIEKFDIDNESYDDILLLKEAHKSKEHVNYKSNNINKISNLCKQIIKNIKNVKIAISNIEINIANINITRNDTLDDQLSLTDQSKQIINNHKRKIEQLKLDEKRRLEEIEERKKQKELEERKKKDEIEKEKSLKKENETLNTDLNRGIKLIEKGLELKRLAGCDDKSIDQDTRLINNIINGKDSNFSDNVCNDNITNKNQASDGNNKIEEGINIVKSWLYTKKQIGYSYDEIISNPTIKNSCITIKRYDTFKPIQSDKVYESEEMPNNYSILKIIMMIIGVVIIGLSIAFITYELNSKYIKHEPIEDNINSEINIIGNPSNTITTTIEIIPSTPLPSPTSNTTPTPPTPTPTQVNQS